MIQWDSTFATGFFILYRGEHMNNGKGRFDRKVFAVFVVLLMLASNPIIIMEGSEESDAALPSNTFTYTITPDGNIVGNYTAIAGDAAESGAYTSNNGTNVGSWGFDSKGYGPFGSFYAAFDPTQNNKMICHLNPNDLTKSVDGVSISGKGYNIMWCLPTVYWSTDSSGNLILSNDSSKGTAYAHTIDGYTYKFIGIGVYEASTKSIGGVGTILTSTSGDTPLVGQIRATFRDYANNQSVNTAGTGNNGHAMVWNFYQWELYKYCALAVMGSWDSQGVAGNGSSYGGSPYYDKPGLLDTSGPYAGKRGSVTNTTYTQDPVKVFIENAWGSVYDFVDGVVIMNKSLVVDSKSIPTDATVAGTNVVVYSSILPDSSGYGSAPSTKAGVWGMPTATNGTKSSGLYDYIYSDTGSNYVLYVGGCSNATSSGAPKYGLSYADAYNDLSNSITNLGGRLAFVFDADLASTPTVTLDHSNLTAAGGNATGFKTSLDITDGATYPNLNTVTSNPSIQAGWTHIGWEVNGKEYKIGASLASTESHTAKSLWAEPKMIIMDHSALSSLGGPVTDLPSTEKIDDATTTYPDLNSAEYAFYTLGFRHTGWYDANGNFYAIGSPVIQTTSHTVKSAWIVPQITITFMVEGEEYSTLQVPKGSVGVVYTPLMVEGVFEGWYYDAGFTKKYQADKALDGPTTLYAKGVPPLEFTSIPTASATITKVNPYGLFFFDATDSTGKYQIEWDFGDGNTSTDAIAYNTYVEPGVYKVTLKITNLYGDVATETFDVIYGDQPDSADGPVRSIMSVLVVALVVIVVAGVLIRRVL